MNNNRQLPAIRRFKAYLTLERSLSANTVEAYLRDVLLLLDFLDEQHIDYTEATCADLEQFVVELA